MLSSDESGGSGHWSISTLLKSMSMPLVPLEKMNKAHFVIRCLLFSSVSLCVGQKWNRITTGKTRFCSRYKALSLNGSVCVLLLRDEIRFWEQLLSTNQIALCLYTHGKKRLHAKSNLTATLGKWLGSETPGTCRKSEFTRLWSCVVQKTVHACKCWNIWHHYYDTRHVTNKGTPQKKKATPFIMSRQRG